MRKKVATSFKTLLGELVQEYPLTIRPRPISRQRDILEVDIRDIDESELPDASVHKSRTGELLGLFVLSLLVYTIFSYGGIRSPDGELLYRTAEALAKQGTFAINDLESWPDFAVATGTDGEKYAIYGPLQPIITAPLVPVGEWFTETNWWKHFKMPPISHYVDDGLTDVLSGRRPVQEHNHAVRAFVAYFNALIGALCVVVFSLVLRRQAIDSSAVFWMSILFAFASPLFVFSGTFFTEPLSTLCLLLALFFLEGETSDTTGHPGQVQYFLAGLSLGLAAAAHVTMPLFFPFFFVLALGRSWETGRNLYHLLRNGIVFACAILVIEAALAGFNFLRFGNIFDTGYLHVNIAFNSPWSGIWGLLFSCGRGLFVYCPIAIFSVVGVVVLIRKRPFFGTTIVGMVIARFFLVASFHDWHGGFGLGPRYLLPITPFLLLAAAYGLGRIPKYMLLVLAFTCIALQVWFASGEIFSYQHRLRVAFVEKGLSVFTEDRLYLDCELSPFNPQYILKGETGPMIWRALGWVPMRVFLFGCLSLPGGILLYWFLFWRRKKQKKRTVSL